MSPLLVVPLLLLVGIGIFLVTKTLVASEGAQQPASSQNPSPTTAVSGSEVDTSGSGVPTPTCGEVSATDAYGNQHTDLVLLVRGIHDAVCRRDYVGLLPYMADSFGFNGFPKREVVAEWEREDSDGYLLQILAETLETQALGDQGGQYYCHPSGAFATFSRGTYDRPGVWSGFDIAGDRGPAICEGIG